MNESQTLTNILYRTRKSAIAMMEKELGCGKKKVSTEVDRVYKEHVESVELLRGKLGKEKPRSE